MRISRPILLCLLALLVFSCGSRQEKASDGGEPSFEPEPYSREFVTGPLKLRLSLDRTHLRLYEDIRMTLEAQAPEEYRMELPKLEEGVTQFHWELLENKAPELREDGQMHVCRVVRLGALVIPDKLAIAPIAMHFYKGDKEYSVETEEVEVKVEMPPEEFWEQLDIKDGASVSPVTRLAAPMNRLWFWVGGGCALLVLAVASCLFLRRRKRRGEQVVLPPPHEIALELLRRLVEQKFVEQGRIMEFYNGIQDILRQYIEGRFNIHAPERTTEEFMAELRLSQDRCIGQYRKQLEAFLTHCDLVRFAAQTPEKQEIQRTFDACRDFIMATAVEETAAVREEHREAAV